MNDQQTRSKTSRENFFFGENAVINSKLQFRLVFINLVVFLGYLISSLVFVSIKINNTDFLNVPKNILKIEFFLPLTLIFVTFSIISVMVNMYQSFKASAPIYRLSRYFRDVASSEQVLPLSFRKEDYYQELPPLVVEAFKRVREKDFLEYTQSHKKFG